MNLPIYFDTLTARNLFSPSGATDGRKRDFCLPIQGDIEKKYVQVVTIHCFEVSNTFKTVLNHTTKQKHLP